MDTINEIYVTKPYLPPLSEYMEYIREIWNSCILTNHGPLHMKFEQQLQKKFGWLNVSLFTNGHLALEIAIGSMGMKNGGEIITTPFTFVSTVAAIVNQGFVPVFCDIGENFSIDADKIEDLITDRTVCILPVHVYGFPCNVEKIEEVANQYGLKVIYDAAHASGSNIKTMTYQHMVTYPCFHSMPQSCSIQ